MSFRASSLLGVTLLLAAVGWPGIAQAAWETRPIHPWYSSARFQIAHITPIPITLLTPPPRGPIRPPGPGVTVQQATTPETTVTTLPSGRPIAMAPSRLTYPGHKFVLPAYLRNPALFQANTSITVGLPGTAATLRAGGRTGPATVTFCAGQTVTTNYNPACTDAGVGVINGLMRYTKTANQFGGVAQGAMGGGMDIGFIGAGAPPCNFATTPCVVKWADGRPPPTRATGGPFGFYNSSSRPPPNPGSFNVVVQTYGTIVYMTPIGWSGGRATPVTTFGGPWTTGRVTISVPSATPGARIFTLTGSDTRRWGEGRISLVAGAFSQSYIGRGPHPNQGWMTLYVPEPGATLGALGALLILAACHSLARHGPR